MSKRIITLVRHAKSSWDNPEWSDLERPLNKRGNKDLPMMSQLIASKIEKPDLIYSSPAVRAITTAKAYAEAFGFEQDKIIVDKEIYERGSRYIIELIKNINPKWKSIMIFGHNPDMTSLASYFTGDYFQNVPTSGTVCVEFDIKSWAEIDTRNGKLIFFEYPKLHKINT